MFISKKRFAQIKAGALPLWLMCAAAVADDRFSLDLGVQEYWDSNFARRAEVNSEHYTRATVAIAANQRFSKQHLSARLQGNQYRFAERDDLDADFYEGNASWRSDWTTRFKTGFSWNRDAYPVDRLEFSGKDVVALDVATAQATLGIGPQISIGGGVRQGKQTHSNEVRESLDYDEDEVFVELIYAFGPKTSLTARVREGERLYPYPDPINPRVLDFEFQQRELEAIWEPSTKTRLTALVGQFDREGEINEGVGTQALLDATWQRSEKLSFSVGYSYSEPAQGETSDSPSAIRSGQLRVTWEPTDKWAIGMAARYGEQSYPQRDQEPARDETIVALTPLTLTYRFSDLLTLRADSQWVDRRSQVLYRDYDYALGSLGLGVKF